MPAATSCWRWPAPLLEGRAAPTHSNASDGMLEISALGVSKASALARLAARLGIEAADVVAFGDMPNDIEMLRLGRPVVRDGRRPPGGDRRRGRARAAVRARTAWLRSWRPCSGLDDG